MRITIPVALIVVVLAAAAWQKPEPPPFGFTVQGAAAHRDIEKRFLGAVAADRIRDAHLYLADKPHIAGSERDRELAEWTRARFAEYGLEQVEIVTHEVLLPWPEEVVVEMTSP